jgi:hypothetical protein
MSELSWWAVIVRQLRQADLSPRKQGAAEESHQEGSVMEELVLLSVLSLDLDAPGGGWPVYLAGRGIAVVEDDLGRLSIARADARQLFVERREAEVRARELTERQDAEAEARRLASIRPGWTRPPGMSVAEAIALLSMPSRVTPGRGVGRWWRMRWILMGVWCSTRSVRMDRRVTGERAS